MEVVREEKKTQITQNNQVTPSDNSLKKKTKRLKYERVAQRGGEKEVGMGKLIKQKESRSGSGKTNDPEKKMTRWSSLYTAGGEKRLDKSWREG